MGICALKVHLAEQVNEHPISMQKVVIMQTSVSTQIVSVPKLSVVKGI
jgi:hypothetical protein